MHLDKAQVVRGVALQCGNATDVQPGMRHCVAHGDTVGVQLVQPFGLEVAGERTGPQKGGLEALAFFFGKGDNFQPDGQALPLCGEPLHNGQRHVDSQAPIVFSAIAHRVKVAPGQQIFGRKWATTRVHIA